MASPRRPSAFATRFLAMLALASAASPSPASPQAALPPPDRIVEMADALVTGKGVRRAATLEREGPGGSMLTYRFECWIRDEIGQRMRFVEPAFDRGDQALRSGDRLYFKYRDWPRYDTMSSRSSFLDSPLSWDDALGLGLSKGYEAAAISSEGEGAGDGRLLRVELRPRGTAAYRRVDLVVDPLTWRTASRTYYSPSGRPWKVMRFKDWRPGAGGAAALPGFTIEISDELSGARAAMTVGPGRFEPMPRGFFEAADLLKGNQE